MKKYIIIDNDLYELSQEDYKKIEIAHIDCIGSFNAETSKNLHNETNNILEKYHLIQADIMFFSSKFIPIKDESFEDVDNLPF